MSITSCEPRLGDGEPNKGGEDPSNPDSRDYVKFKAAHPEAPDKLRD